MVAGDKSPQPCRQLRPFGSRQCALAHPVARIAIAIALALLGAVIAIGMVIWSIWDKNGQGVDDKIAKTFVVEL